MFLSGLILYFWASRPATTPLRARNQHDHNHLVVMLAACCWGCGGGRLGVLLGCQDLRVLLEISAERLEVDVELYMDGDVVGSLLLGESFHVAGILGWSCHRTP